MNTLHRAKKYIGAQFKIARIGEPIPYGMKIDSPVLAFNYWNQFIKTKDWFDDMKEHLVVLTLNTRYEISGFSLISMGSLNESIAHPRDILRPVIISGSYAFVLVHNHPSGDASPSEADHRLTRRICEASTLMQVSMLDHVIAGFPAENRTGYFSFKEAGIV
jgi:DNA repair protein RadC